MCSALYFSPLWLHASLQAAGGGERGDEGRQRKGKSLKNTSFQDCFTYSWTSHRADVPLGAFWQNQFISLEDFIRTPRMHEGACALSPCSAASVSINIKDLHMESSDNIISGCGLSSLWQRNATLCLDP